MAILIERSTTPVYANAMNVDTDANGVVDGFVKSVNSSITATFSLNDSAQKIEITASTGSGVAVISLAANRFAVSPNTVYSLQVLTRGSITAGTPKLLIKIDWLDSSNTFISTSMYTIDTNIYTYWKQIKYENVTSPSNAAYASMVLGIQAQAAGDTGAVWFRNVMLEQSTICSTFTTTTRAADNAYIDIAPLTGEWALSGAFALPYDSNADVKLSDKLTAVACLNDTNKPTDNVGVLFWSSNTKLFQFRKYIDASPRVLSISATPFNAYQIHKFIISQGNGGMHLYIRKNNGTTIEAHNTNIDTVTFNRLYCGYYNPVYHPNAFIESVTLYRNKAITTLAEADAIFDSMNAELVVNGDFSNGSTGWTLYNGAVVENGMLKHVASAASGILTIAGVQSIKVLPNNTYKLKARLIGYVDNSNKPRVTIEERDIFNIVYTQGTAIVPTSYDQILETTFITSANTYFIRVVPQSTGSGTFYWDDISVKLVN